MRNFVKIANTKKTMHNLNDREILELGQDMAKHITMWMTGNNKAGFVSLCHQLHRGLDVACSDEAGWDVGKPVLKMRIAWVSGKFIEIRSVYDRIIVLVESLNREDFRLFSESLKSEFYFDGQGYKGTHPFFRGK